jgi:hypothetical protein
MGLHADTPPTQIHFKDEATASFTSASRAGFDEEAIPLSRKNVFGDPAIVGGLVPVFVLPWRQPRRKTRREFDPLIAKGKAHT